MDRYEWKAFDGIRHRVRRIGEGEVWAEICQMDGDPEEWELVNNGDDVHEELLRLAEENARLRKKSDEADMLTAELIGRLDLDREAIDRSGEPVGNAILDAVRDLILAERGMLWRRTES